MGQLVDRVAEMEAALGRGDWLAANDYLHPAIRYRVGALPAVTGIDAVRAYMEHQARHVTWVGHEMQLEIEAEDVAIIEVISLFDRVSDGARIRLPCTDIYRFEDGLIADWRVYADLRMLGVAAD